MIRWLFYFGFGRWHKIRDATDALAKESDKALLAYSSAYLRMMLATIGEKQEHELRVFLKKRIDKDALIDGFSYEQEQRKEEDLRIMPWDKGFWGETRELKQIVA